MATFVLVHGAWHGGWCWARVAEPLRAAGHRVFTPTLTGVGERAHLLARDVDLMTHVRDVSAVIEHEEIDKVVLCGHSYGGMVITGVAEEMADRLDALVYLDAFLPAPGDSLADGLPPERRQAQRDRIAADWKVPPPSAEYFKVNEADRTWVDRRCTPQPGATMVQGLPHTNPWERVRKRVYVRAAGYDPSPFAPIAARLKGDPAWEVVEVGCGHDVMVDAPERLVEILSDSAR